MAAHVFVPSQNVYGPVSFLVDTGADATVLMPVDIQRLGIDYGRLGMTTRSTGIGGESEDFVESAVVVFADEMLHLYNINLTIMKDRPELIEAPSLLGRDVINRWRMVLDHASDLFTAEIISSDDQLAIP
jgi:predicted aspartyl protease